MIIFVIIIWRGIIVKVFGKERGRRFRLEKGDGIGEDNIDEKIGNFWEYSSSGGLY